MVEISTKPKERLKEDLSTNWQAHLKNWQESELSQAEYCRRHNLKYHQFLYRKKQFFKQSAYGKGLHNSSSHDALTFVELGASLKEYVTPSPPATGIRMSEKSLRFWVNCFCIEVDNHFSTDALSRLVRLLRTV